MQKDKTHSNNSLESRKVLKYCFLGSIYNAYSGQATGGAELQLSKIICQLNKLGHKVSVIDLKIKKDIITKEGIHFYALKKTKPINFSYLQIYRLCKKIKADVYYVRVRNARQLIPLYYAKITGAKFFYHVAHDLDTVSFKVRREKYYRKTEYLYNLKKFIHAELAFPIILKFADQIFVQHKIQRDNLRKKGYKSVKIIYNLFSFPTENKKPIEKLPNRFYIILGSLDERKGVESLYKLIEQLVNKNFVIIGQARDKMGNRFIKMINNKSNVTFINSIRHNEVFTYLQKSEALISVSKMEGFSNTFLECWSVGKPVYSLHAEAGGNIQEHHLGICFKGDMQRMIDVLQNNTHSYDSKKLISYVNTFHDPLLNTQKIIGLSNK